MFLLTKLSVSGSSQKNGFPSFSCFLTKFSMSTSKLAEVVPSDPCVDCSHFSNNSANKGNRGCLGTKAGEWTGLEMCVNFWNCQYDESYLFFNTCTIIYNKNINNENIKDEEQCIRQSHFAHECVHADEITDIVCHNGISILYLAHFVQIKAKIIILTCNQIQLY